MVDFDGTLAPIVDVPAAARPDPAAADLLGRLSERWGEVAVVSGRPVSFLAEHLRGAGATRLFGLYGMERTDAGGGGQQVAPGVERWRSPVGEAADELSVAVPEGVAIERKGLTVTVHWRAVPDLASSAAGLAGEVAARFGLLAHPGKMSVELRPPVEVDKGTVVAELARGLLAVLFAGDDIGDLPAFAALDRLKEQGVETLGVAVGGEEMPPEVSRVADLVAAGPADLVRLLERLA